MEMVLIYSSCSFAQEGQEWIIDLNYTQKYVDLPGFQIKELPTLQEFLKNHLSKKYGYSY